MEKYLSRTPLNVLITPRQPLKIAATKEKYWYDNGNVSVTTFFQALSLVFPQGDGFFVRSVLAFKDRVHDP